MRLFSRELVSTNMMSKGWKDISFNSLLYSVAYGNGVFIASSYGQVFISSDNGKTWTSKTVTASGGVNWYGVGYGYKDDNPKQHYFALAGSSGKYTYSTDNGQNWRNVSSFNHNNNDYYSVCMSRFGSYYTQYYVGEQGDFSTVQISDNSTTTNTITGDGSIDWSDCYTQRTSPFDGSVLIIGNGYYVIGTRVSISSNKRLINSTIGEHNTPHIRKVNGKYIVTAKNYGLHIAGSDPLNLRTATNNRTCPVNPVDIGYINNMYVVAGTNGIAWSPNLNNWDYIPLTGDEPTSLAVSDKAIVITKGHYLLVKQLA